MRKNLWPIIAVAILFSSSFSFADQVTLANGDRITGTIKSSDGSTLVIKTDYAGELTLKWSAVKTVTSDDPLYVTAKDGRQVAGKVTSTGDNIEVGGATLAKDSIKTMRSKSAQDEVGAWGGFIDSGLSLSRGNSETTNFTLGANAVRSTEVSKTSLFATSLYAKSTLAGVSTTTASAINAGARYDRNISDRTFAFVFTNFDHDRFQQLDLRNVIGGGLGYHAIKTAATTLDLSAGATFNQEYYSTFTRRSAEVVAGEALDHKLNGAVTLHERLDFYPNLSETGEYRMVFDTALITKIHKFLSWQVDVSDRYQNNPLFGLKKNDLLLTTGIRVTFGPQGK